MALGLYKPGQGYWVRVLAATMAGVLIAAASAWLWNELQKAGQYIPRPTWSMPFPSGVTGQFAAGQTLQLLGEPAATTGGSPGPREDLGTAVVQQVDPAGTMVTIRDVKMKVSKDPSAIRAVVPASPPGAAPVALSSSSGPQGVPLFDPLYLQGAGVALLVILGAAMAWWLVGMNPATVEFLIATDGEMKKVNWSTRKDIIGSTWVVILWSVLLAAGLWAVDFLFSQFFKLIHVLQS
jgi:preprotein translocase SecE subunit